MRFMAGASLDFFKLSIELTLGSIMLCLQQRLGLVEYGLDGINECGNSIWRLVLDGAC